MRAQPITIHVLDLTQPAEESLLSPDERERAARLVIPQARRRFVAARAGLRETLAQAVNQPPGKLVFAAGEHGKPALSGLPNAPHFNLSHSDDLALIALADVPLGVDVERVRPLSALPEMMAMAFTDLEREALESLGESDRLGAFFRLWTRKEALTKADGRGFRMIKTFDAWENPARIGDFTVQNVTVADGCAAAVAACVPSGAALDIRVRLSRT